MAHIGNAAGIIIAASIVVAAGIAIYENPQVRQWIDNYRQRIAIALHGLGDEIQPPNRSYEDEKRAIEERRRRRDEIVRQNRMEMMQKAREEGIAVDLDALELVEQQAEQMLADEELARRMQHEWENEDEALARRLQEEWNREESGTRGVGDDTSVPVSISRRPTTSFDDLVGSDGTLLSRNGQNASSSTGAEAPATEGLRRRGAGRQDESSTAFSRGATYANPFADETAELLFDHQLIGASTSELPSPQVLPFQPSRESTATLEAEPQLTNVDPRPMSDTSSIAPAPAMREMPRSEDQSLLFPGSRSQTVSPGLGNDPAQSFYSFTSDNDSLYNLSERPTTSPIPAAANIASSMPHEVTNDEDSDEDDGEIVSAGTLTPTEEGWSTAASQNGDDLESSYEAAASSAPHWNQNQDMMQISQHLASLQPTPSHEDARSEAFSEGGFSDVEHTGAQTPNSWSDVGSDAGSEDAQHGAPTQAHL